jgi:hypothetical protein
MQWIWDGYGEDLYGSGESGDESNDYNYDGITNGEAWGH